MQPLPSELWLMICSYDLYGIDIKALRLCSRWLATLLFLPLLRRLVCHRDNIPDIIQRLDIEHQFAHSVASIRLSDVDLSYIPPLSALVSSGRLQNLYSLSWETLESELSAELMTSIAQNCPNFRHLTIFSNARLAPHIFQIFRNLDSFTFATQNRLACGLLELLRMNPNLKKLDFRAPSLILRSPTVIPLMHLREVHARQSTHLISLLTPVDNNFLTSLTLEPSSLDFDWIQWLSLHHNSYPNLTHLQFYLDPDNSQRVSMARFPDATLLPFITSLPLLQSIALCGANDDDIAFSLLRDLHKLPRLQQLSFGVESISDSMKATFISFLPKALNKFALRVGYCAEPRTEWLSYLSVLRTLPNLTSIGLQGRHVQGPQGIACVSSKIIEVCPRVEWLQLGTLEEWTSFRVTTGMDGERRVQEFQL